MGLSIKEKERKKRKGKAVSRPRRSSSELRCPFGVKGKLDSPEPDASSQEAHEGPADRQCVPRDS